MNTSTNKISQNNSLQAFSALKERLEKYDRLFIKHQQSLMHKDFESAQMQFEELYEKRRLHLQMMEELLLPYYEEALQEYPKGGRPIYFIREKKLILKELSKFIRLNGTWLINTSTVTLDIVQLFEDYVWFKDLLDHHDAREKAFLFPVLEKKLGQARCHEILGLIDQKYAALEKEWPDTDG